MAPAATVQVTKVALPSKLRLIYGIFAVSGASSLVLETIFTRLLTYTFGNTAHAVSTVLAAFLGGLALGAYVLGKFSDRRTGSLRGYAALELLIALYCLAIPALFSRLTQVYLAACHYWNPGPFSLLALRFVFAAIPILIPSFLMGGTLPVLTRYVVATRLGKEAEINRLYGWNTVGAALGTLLSTYALIPALGVKATIWSACAADAAIATAALLLCVREESFLGRSMPAARPSSAASPSRHWMLVLAFLTGTVALGYEVLWSHVQAFTIGSTVYAFGTMLFTVLCGLGLGAQLVSRRLQQERLWAPALAASQLLLGVAVFATVPLWGRMNYVFEHSLRGVLLAGVGGLFVFRMVWTRAMNNSRQAASRAQFGLASALFLLIAGSGFLLFRSAGANFITSELVRFFSCFYLLIVPAILLGVSFPLLLSMGGSGDDVAAASSVGAIYAANTLGAITGSVLTGFLVLPRLGSEVTLRMLASFDLLLGMAVALILLSLSPGKKMMLAGSVCALLLAGLFLPRWDFRTLLRGSYVYFAPAQKVDRVLYSREDVQGGLSSVIETGTVRTLLSNAKFQGDNGDQIQSQIRFALIPAIFAAQYHRALVIGLGTGNTLHVVSSFPFQYIDVAELAPHIVQASSLWFSDVNGGVLQNDPRVRVNLTDGRNFLLLARAQYDLITVEISSIWISGEADLYNREFYELCRDHLARGGVLQQWVQLHHMRRRDLLTIFNTAAQVFPHLAFFVGPGQGVLLASRSPLAFDFAKSERLDRDPHIRLQEQRLGIPTVASFLGEIMLYDESMQKAISFLPDGGGPHSHYVSTDSHPYLEYATPKGNVLAYNAAYANYTFLLALRPSQLPAGLVLLNVPSANERNLILGYASEQRGDSAAALRYFEAVRGPVHDRAQVEIGRLTGKGAALTHP
ncbi:MAG TPA: fused MFS/spermidine synthase [Terriglobales bacterium]|nr:fused MFS/spermidine synthase [Terriglobales bacterium]